MIIRKLDNLALGDSLKKVETDVFEKKGMGMVYVPDRGFVFYEDDSENKSNLFIIKTKTKPSQYLDVELDKKLEKNKKEFISIIDIILNDIYQTGEIKEYEKKHPEYIFLELFDNFINKNYEEITKEDPFYDVIDDGFIRLELDQFKTFATSTATRIRNILVPEPQNKVAAESLDEKLKKFKENSTNGKHCTKCGASNLKDSKFCEKCGAEI